MSCYRFRRGVDRRRLRLTAALASAVTLLALATGTAPPAAAAASAAKPKAAPASPASAAADFGAKSSSSADLAVDAFGDGQGYHVQVATERSGFTWRQLAVLKPAGLDESSWTGYQCTSGDGRFEAVAVLPGSAVNTTTAREHGAFAYSVDLATGQVRPIASGVALVYFSPGCGTGDEAEFTVQFGADEQSAQVLTANLATGKVEHATNVAGQLTSTVPTASGVVGVLGGALVRIPETGAGKGKPVRIAATDGQAFDLRPAADGGVDFLSMGLGAPTARVEHEHAGIVTVLGSGAATQLNLFQGRAGHNTLIGADGSLKAGSDLRSVKTGALADPAYTSLDGDAVFGDEQITDTLDPSLLAVPTGRIVKRSADKATGTRPDEAVSAVIPAGVDAASSQPNFPAPITGKTAAGTAAKASAVKSDAVQPATAQTPACAVPRNDPHFQVLQPSNAQVDWAVQMAEQNLLTSANLTRPANYQNMGLVAYSPNSDFPEIPLDHPSSSTWSTVPRSVYEAILAQESNWDQASWHALPGIIGNPIVADYYGSAGTITSIDYAAADCGYGIGQVTTGMFASQTGQEYSLHGQEKIAVDYAENIAAGLQILENTWNQLYTAGITANGGDPQDLENWYYAIWAYNTGIEPNAAHGNTTGCTPGPSCLGPDGTWGLGWTNNPADPDFPPNRKAYLQTTYADAAHPGDWPYQERVLGWMGSPLKRLGSTAYAPPTYATGSPWLTPAPFMDFCSTSGNDCTPGTAGTSAGTCTLSDSECWWHSPVTWIGNCGAACVNTTFATSPYTVSGGGEPATNDPHPPVCSLDTSIVPSSAIIVAAQVGVANGALPVDDVGCGTSNWTDGGSFTMANGTNANGDPIGAIDTHQLGVGFGGYIMFTHTQDGSNPSIMNTGTWTPTLPSTQYYTVLAHIPATGATTGDALYTVNSGASSLGAASVRVNQHLNQDAWIELGTFPMTPGGNVQLSNLSGMTPGGYDVGFDAMAFEPRGGDPSTGVPLGGVPTFPDDPIGQNPSLPDCPCTVDSVGDPVSSSTGYFGDTYKDLAVPGRGMPLDFTRTYASGEADPNGPNGSLAADGPFGWGWTDSYNLSASTDSTTGNVTIHQEDGSQVAFADSSGTYAPTAPRFLATLTKAGSTYVFGRQGKEFFTFDAATGHLLAEQSLAGRMASPQYSTTMAYNSSGQLSTITDPAGRTFTLGWTGGHITSLTDSAGREVSYGYDASGDLTDVYGVGTTRSPSLLNNDHTVYTYNTTTHLITSVRQPDFYGDTTTSPSPVLSMTYDTSERVTKQTDQLGRTTTFTYGPSTSPSLAAGQTLITMPSGDETLDTYTNNLLTQQVKGYGSATPSTVKYSYDPASLGVTSITDPNGHVQTFSYDARGNRITASNSLGQTTTFTYDALNDLTSSTDPLGVKTSYGYDQAGHIATSTGTNGGTLQYGLKTSTAVQQMDQSADIVDANPGVLPSRTSSYYYDNAAFPADLTRSVDGDGNTAKSSYDAEGDLVSTTDGAGDITEYGYNTNTGQRTSEVDADGAAAGTPVACTPPALGCTTYSYDAFGNLTGTTDANGHTTGATFDADGNKLTSTDGDQRKTTYTSDAANELTGETLPDATTAEHFAYTPDGLLGTYTDGTGAKTVTGYDAQDRKSSVTDGDNRKTTYGYDAAGNVTTLTDPAGAVTTYSYNNANEPTKVSYSDGKTAATTLGYNSDGQRISMADASGTTSWSYNAFGEIVSETDGAGATVGYAYDDNGNQTSIVYPAGAVQTVTQTFDKAGRLSSVKDWNSATTSFGYDADGALTSITYPDGDKAAYAYDNAEVGMSATLSGAATASITYTRDNANQISSMTPTGVPGSTQTDGYNTNQQLNAVTSGGTTTAYAYNGAGDPTDAGGSGQAFDAAGQLCWTLPGATSTNACTSVPTGATRYGYDTQGERTSATPATGTASTYTYNQASQLTGYTGPDGAASYTYDGQGLRTGKTAGSTATAYTWSIGSTPELLSDGITDYLYGPGSIPIEQLAAAGPSSTSLWYLHDLAGNTRALLGTTGAIAGAYGYDAYGTPTHTGTAGTPLQFGGGYTDAESGLIYLRARYYDPATEQFLTVDPLVAKTLSPYDYTGGNPLSSFDPNGTSWLDDLGDDLESAAGDLEEVAADAAPVVLPVVADVVVDGIVEVATDGAGTAVLPELDAEIDGAIDSGLEAGDAAETDAAEENGWQQQDWSDYEPSEEDEEPFQLNCDDGEEPYGEYASQWEEEDSFEPGLQGNNEYHNDHLKAILKQYGITSKADIRQIHDMLGDGVDGNANATDEEIMEAAEEFLGGFE